MEGLEVGLYTSAAGGVGTGDGEGDGEHGFRVADKSLVMLRHQYMDRV
jgi:hypothetical protein